LSQHRWHALRGEEVVYANHRQARTFLPSAAECPLCPTHPGGAPTEIPRPHFEIAVFENRFPSFGAPFGATEVVVYTPDHDGSLGALPPERAELLMQVWRDRYVELAARPDVAYVMIFENRGVEVGVTLHHPHGQVYAYPFVPPVPAREREADRALGGCAVCAAVAGERADGRRILIEGPAVAYVPYAARFPYEVHVTMAEHRPSLADCSAAELRHLARALQRIARGLDALFARPLPYVMVVHQASCDGHGDGHLHVEFYPPHRSRDRLKYLAGSELGAGTFIVDALPEDTAAEIAAALYRSG
jgi:UDPglucose--hexose-1-phosphate uridylyltransferase